MKRLLAAGFGDCYQVCPVFRDGESGRLHNPEFTMIEWYRLDYGMAEMQHDVDRVLRVACAEVRAFAPTSCISYRDAMRAETGIDCRSATPAEIRAALAARGIEPAEAGDWDRDAWLDLLMGAVVGPTLGHDAPVFVEDYPASQAALARLRAEQRRHAWSRIASSCTWTGWSSRTATTSSAMRPSSVGDSSVTSPHGRRTGRPAIRSTRTCWQRSRTACRIAPGVALGFDRLVMAAWRLPSLDAAMAFPASTGLRSLHAGVAG